MFCCLQLHGMLRVVMEPLLGDMPLIGALSVFFLNKPVSTLIPPLRFWSLSLWQSLSNIVMLPPSGWKKLAYCLTTSGMQSRFLDTNCPKKKFSFNVYCLWRLNSVFNLSLFFSLSVSSLPDCSLPSCSPEWFIFLIQALIEAPRGKEASSRCSKHKQEIIPSSNSCSSTVDVYFTKNCRLLTSIWRFLSFYKI